MDGLGTLTVVTSLMVARMVVGWISHLTMRRAA